jgi:hypothetical protein
MDPPTDEYWIPNNNFFFTGFITALNFVFFACDNFFSRDDHNYHHHVALFILISPSLGRCTELLLQSRHGPLEQQAKRYITPPHTPQPLLFCGFEELKNDN